MRLHCKAYYIWIIVPLPLMPSWAQQLANEIMRTDAAPCVYALRRLVRDLLAQPPRGLGLPAQGPGVSRRGATAAVWLWPGAVRRGARGIAARTALGHCRRCRGARGRPPWGPGGRGHLAGR